MHIDEAIKILDQGTETLWLLLRRDRPLTIEEIEELYKLKEGLKKVGKLLASKIKEKS